MPICSYLVLTAEGAADAVNRALSALPGCEAVRATGHDMLLLVTETDGREEEAALATAIERVEGIRALVLTFGEIVPDRLPVQPTEAAAAERSLPVLDPAGIQLASGAGPPRLAESR